MGRRQGSGPWRHLRRHSCLTGSLALIERLRNALVDAVLPLTRSLWRTAVRCASATQGRAETMSRQSSRRSATLARSTVANAVFILAAAPFAGGIMQNGYQCGMIWGAALAAGAQACRVFGPGPQAETMAVVAAERLVERFHSLNKNINSFLR